MNINLETVAKYVKGKLSANSSNLRIIKSVSIDSRSLQVGGLYIALKGEKFNGNDFINKCFQNGAVACITSDEKYLTIPNVIYVLDTLVALGQLASCYRNQFNIPIIAITGSNGKTTLKEMLFNVCKLEFGAKHVLATKGNLNNHIGVPLTLLELDVMHKVAIIEMGMNHKGEIDYLTRITRPNMAIINNVMLSHIGFFKSIREIFEAKGEIFQGLAYNGIACINTNINEYQDYITAIERLNRNIKIYKYGKLGDSCYIENFIKNGAIIQVNEHKIQINLNVLGKHNYYNALSAIALSVNINIPTSIIVKGLNTYLGFDRRLEKKIAFNNATIIDDTYNASPDSTKAALLILEEFKSPKWFIFANMAELGEMSQHLHEGIGEFANGKVDFLITIGELARFTYSKFLGSKLHFDNNVGVIQYCKNNLPVNATLLIKGSKITHMEQIVKELVK